jgi:hypothetical protein
MHLLEPNPAILQACSYVTAEPWATWHASIVPDGGAEVEWLPFRIAAKVRLRGFAAKGAALRLCRHLSATHTQGAHLLRIFSCTK